MVRRAMTPVAIKCAAQIPENQWLVPRIGEKPNKKAASRGGFGWCMLDSIVSGYSRSSSNHARRPVAAG
jgi:hypothetical protein